MILLFAGSTPMVRSALAEKMIEENETWRHLAIEGLAESMEQTGEEFDEEQLHAVVCNCARTMQHDGYHLILSVTDAKELLPILRNGIEEDFLAIHLGDIAENQRDSFDHVIDTANASIKDIYDFLQPLVSDPPEA